MASTDTPERQTPGLATLRLRWSRCFRGTPEQVTFARHWIQELLPTCQARDDLLTVASELTANAVKHTRSNQPGGIFSIDFAWCPDMVRMVVGDQGAPTQPTVVPDSDGIGGLGLFVVSKMARQWGVVGGQDGRQVWADMPWHSDGGRVPAVLAVLRHQYPQARAWYGETTGQWWAALPRTGETNGVISADSPAELTGLLADRYPHRAEAGSYTCRTASAP